MRNFFAIIAAATLFFSCTNKNATDKHEAFVEDLLSQMTLEEKLGQMTLYSSGEDPTVPVFNPDYKNEITKGRCGAIFASITPDSIRYLQSLALQSRLKIPLLFGYDVIHGFKTIFPIPLADAASWDLNAIHKAARITAIEASSQGINWFFGPMVDIARDARWGRISEGAGEDPFLGSKIAVEKIKAYQGTDFNDKYNIAACVKHFAGYGAAVAGKDYNTVILSEQELRDVYLVPFAAASNAGVASMMSAFNEINGVPCTSSKYLLTDILQNEWNFDGFVVSDFASIRELMNHGVAANEEDCAALAINAGLSMDMEASVYKEKFVKGQLENKKIDIRKLDDAVHRILMIKARLGLFDDPYKFCKETENKLLLTAHIEAARDLARKSIVLLKNENDILPISSNSNKRIALIGPLANNQADMLGTWIAQGDTSDVITLFQGLKNQLGKNATLQFSKGCDIDSNDESGFAQAIALAKKSDIVIVALGEKGDMAGEAASRGSINIPGVQTKMLKKLYELGKPLILVLMNGRPLALEEEVQYCDAVVEAWQLGTTAGDAIADVLFGNYNPSGKLTATFPHVIGQVPIYYAAKNTGRPANPKVRYTSRYLDIPFTPLFPFGYGLSYSTYEYSDILVSKSEIAMNEELTVTCSVKNLGKVDGHEIVQLYVRDLVGSVTRPVKELKGFEKVFLKAGESKRVIFKIKPSSDLTFTHADGRKAAEAGVFEVFVGGNSNADLSQKFTLK
jgi:beta-glucosidase